MAARSATTGSPAMSLPRITGKLPLASANASEATISLKLTICRSALGSSMPITVLPGMGDTRALIALMLRAMSSARPTTRLALMPGAGSSSYMVTTGPVRTAVISPLTLKSSSTFSSRRALRSSASLSSLGALSSERSSSRSRLGRSYSANRSFCLALLARAGRGGADGSEISGGLRSGWAMVTGSAFFSALRLSDCGLNGLTSRLSAGGRLSQSGSVSRLAQSTAKTRPASRAPPTRHTMPPASMVQKRPASGSRPASAPIAPSPSNPARPPVPAGRLHSRGELTSASTVESSAIASNSSSTVRHHLPPAMVSSSEASRQSLRPKA